MKIIVLSLSFLFFSVLAVAKDTAKNVSSLQKTFSKHRGDTSPTEHFISVRMEGEGRLSKNKISKARDPIFYPWLTYAELGVRYINNGNLNFFLNFEIESRNNEWLISLDELNLSYTFNKIPFSIKGGWMTLPLGYMDENTNVFSRRLSIYDTLVREEEDVGLTFDLRTYKSFLTLRMGVFGGWRYRESEDLFKAPEAIPIIVSLNSEGKFWSSFASWFKSDLAFWQPVRAYGAGFGLNGSYKNLSAFLQSEFWWVTQKGQTSVAYYVFPRIAVDKLQIGMVWGNINRFSPDFKTARVQSSTYEKVFQLSYQVHPTAVIIGEYLISAQKKGPLLNDLWSFRVKIDFDSSNLYNSDKPLQERL